ncbi:hypothetical protein J4E08_10080 [Sagittula sp. NFXS13]
MTAKKTPALPQSGGSYTRTSKGDLKQVASPTRDAPLPAQAAPAREEKEA